MNILIISLWSISDTSIGGTEKFVIDLANLLSEKYSVTILSLGSVDLDIANINTHSLQILEKLDEYSLFKYLEHDGFEKIRSKISSFIRMNNFDVVHCNSLVFSNLIEGIPVIHTVHTNREELEQSFSQQIVGTILEHIRDDKKAVYVTPSMYAKKSFQKLTKQPALVINHSFSPKVVIGNKIQLKQEYGIRSDEIVFCVPSRLELAQKGQETLLKALGSIKKLLPPFTVVLGGCDEQYIRNKKYLHENYPDLKMVIQGFSNKNDMYSLADVVVLPSKTESFGYAALESAMLGIPLFLSNIPPYKEIAKGNNNIFLFKNNEIDLAKILKSKYEIISEHSREALSSTWKNRYSEKIMLKKYVALFKKCIRDFY